MLQKTKYGLLAPAEQPASRDQGEEAGPQQNQGGGTGDSRWRQRAVGSRARRWRAIGSSTRRRAVYPFRAHIVDGPGQLEDGEEDRIVVRWVGCCDPDLSVALLQEARDAVQLVVRGGTVGISRLTEGVGRIGRAVSDAADGDQGAVHQTPLVGIPRARR